MFTSKVPDIDKEYLYAVKLNFYWSTKLVALNLAVMSDGVQVLFVNESNTTGCQHQTEN
jgi:hypothetical protein